MDDARGATTAAPTAEPSPRTDRLELLQQFAGSVGAVHKARNPKLNRVVALRQVQVPEWLDDVDELIKRILAEARAASALDHPNIARLFTGGYKGFTVFLTSEFVDGQNIKHFASSRNLGVPEIIALGKQLCSALDYAHQKNVIHNALTAANLKVLPDGNLKVLDFGLLREKHLYSPSPAKRLESEHYLSPEQLKNKPVTQATNVFSTATILYELLTTRSPFAGKHLGEVDRNITEIDPSPASLAHPRVSEAISKVLMKGLAKHPLARFQSCAEFATALDEAVKGAPIKAAPSAAAPFPKPAVPIAAPKPANDIGLSPPLKPVSAVSANGHPAVAAAPITDNPSAPITNNTSAPTAPPPRPVSTPARSESLVATAPSKMPAKISMQWKLVGGIVAALFVVLAVAISLNHRSKVPAVAPETTGQTPVQAPEISQGQTPAELPETTDPSSRIDTPAIDTHEPQARRSRAKAARAASASAPAVAADGQLAVSSEPAGATISIEGHTMDSWKTPQVVGSLAPAVYRVTISKSGYASETRNIQVVSGNRASLEVKLTALKATLNVGGTPGGARIVIDGKETGKFSPAEFTLDPAVHTINLHKEGFFDSTESVKLSAGQTLNYSPSLTMAGRTDNIKVVGGGFKKLFGNGGSSAGMVRIEIRSEPKGAQITINGSPVPKTTPTEIQVEPGNYDITVQKDGYKPVTKRVIGQANDRIKIEEQLQQ